MARRFLIGFAGFVWAAAGFLALLYGIVFVFDRLFDLGI